MAIDLAGLRVCVRRGCDLPARSETAIFPGEQLNLAL